MPDIIFLFFLPSNVSQRARAELRTLRRQYVTKGWFIFTSMELL